MRSKEFQTERSTENAGKRDEAGASKEQRKQISAATVEKIGPVIRECLSDYFASLGLSMQDGTGQERSALIQEDDGVKGHSWRAWSRKKTGSHSDYRADGVHLLDEHTAYTITVYLVVDRNNAPLLYIGPYIRSKLVGGVAVVASDFQLEVPAPLKVALGTKTQIKLGELAEYQAAQMA